MDAFVRYAFLFFSEPFHAQYGKMVEHTLKIWRYLHRKYFSHFLILYVKGLIVFYKCQCLRNYSEIVGNFKRRKFRYKLTIRHNLGITSP